MRVDLLVGSASDRVFELTPSGSSATLVLELFDPDASWQLAQEALVYELFGRASVPTPEVLATDSSRDTQRPTRHSSLT